MIKLTKELVVLLHDDLIQAAGGSHGIRDEGLLESAINAPFTGYGNVEQYPSVPQKGARLCFGLVKNHAFIDGNKRIGAHTMLVFLELNGIVLEYTQEELSDVILSVAEGKSDFKDLLKWIIEHQP